MFEEGKIFAQGRNVLPFRAPFGQAGMMICRDFLQTVRATSSSPAAPRSSSSSRPRRAGESPSEGFETSRMWELMGEAVSYFSTAFVLYCNRVGSRTG